MCRWKSKNKSLTKEEVVISIVALDKGEGFYDNEDYTNAPAIRNIKYRYGITGDSANIFRREKIVSAEEKRIC